MISEIRTLRGYGKVVREVVAKMSTNYDGFAARSTGSPAAGYGRTGDRSGEEGARKL